jgi:hypothetical protein
MRVQPETVARGGIVKVFGGRLSNLLNEHWYVRWQC